MGSPGPRESFMKPRKWLLGLLFVFVWAAPAAADNRFIVRSTLSLQGLQSACSALPLLQTCTVVRGIGDPQSQLFLITSPLNLATLLSLAGNPLGIVDAELDQVIRLVGGLNTVTTPPSGLTDETPVDYFGSPVWNGYVSQPAATVVRVSDAQSTFQVAGTGIVADIDTGVDPNHPALQPVLLPGYDFTRNQPGGSEMTDVAGLGLMNPPPGTTTVFNVNQSTAAVLDQSTAAVLDQTQFAAFGHGTMVLGVVHLVAPKAQLMPLKAFSSDGTANLSDILHAIYYAVQNKANVINMSFETQTSSFELSKALDYANQNNVISAASAGNDGQGPNFLVYPAALQNDVMGVASVGSIPGVTDSTRSTFSNFGNSIVWVAAPGEAIITTYPFGTYSAGWGTSFSAPFVSGAGALLLNRQPTTNESQAATAVAHAVNVGADMGNGRLDLVQALQSQPTGTGSDFAVSPSPNNATINAGQPATFTVTATPSGSFNQTVTWSCSGAPSASTCTVSPSAVQLDGTHPANATVTVTTTARSLLPPAPRIQPRFARPLLPWGLVALCLVWLFAWTMLCNLSRASRQRLGFRAATAILVIALCISCGGGYGGPGSNPPPATLSSVTLNPMTVTGGNSSTGTVTLGGYAPSGGATVSLTSSNISVATAPPNVTVAAGASTATFTVNTSAVTASTPVTISATYAGVTKTASLTVTPPAPPGTPAGTYTLTVTGTSGNVSHATTFQLTVN